MKLLCCALASITTPWLERETSHRILLSDSDLADSEDVELSYAFYSAAQKRLGSLGSELIDIQCYIFACIYEKSILRPKQALLHIRQASARLSFISDLQHEFIGATEQEKSLLQRACESTKRAERYVYHTPNEHM
jgi:hypothetical protein